MSVTSNAISKLYAQADHVYDGTKITGTSTTAKVFTKSNVPDARMNDLYLNTAYGHVYICTTPGTPRYAKWKYKETLVLYPPKSTVTGLGAPVRTTVGSANHYMKATWKVPKAMTDPKKYDRASGLKVTWLLSTAGATQDIAVAQNVGTGVTESQINLNTFTVGSRTYNRTAFWPFTKKKLVRVSANVQGTNFEAGKSAIATRSFTVPKAPTISGFTFNSANGHVSATITTDAGAGYAERYDTHYKVYVTDTRTGKTWVATDNTSTAASITAAYDVTDYQQLTYGQYVKVTVSAWARGYAGNSDIVSRTYYVSYPAQTTIRGVDITSKSSSGRCVARINTNNTAAHPVDGVKLEYLANCEYATAGSIPGTAEWDDSGAQDDAQCTALTMSVTDLIPDAGNYTWIRVKSYHAYEAVLHRYSNYIRLKALETPAPTATDERVKILSATAGDDGESVVVHLGWNASGTDDATGTELSWSEDSDTWRSTEEPETYEFTWSDGAVTVGGVTYNDSATLTIKNLEGGTKYYIRARRYLDGDTTTYSPYSNTKTCLTSTAPEAVTATCERYVPSGQPLPVRWTFAGNSTQKEWQIVSNGGKVIANGRGSAGSAKISANRLKSVATGGAPIKPTTKSGPIVTFDADEDTVISSLKVAITPKQAGSGDPSPSNVRPITGTSTVNISLSPYEQTEKHTITGKNLYNAPNDQMNVLVPCHIASGTQVTISASSSSVPGFRYYDANKQQIDYWTLSSAASDGRRYRAFTTIGACEYVEFYGALGTDFMVETGVTVPSPYEPYGTHTPVPLGQTVYGGEVDVTTGVMKTYPYYSSYNGETLTGAWMCDRAIYSEGNTPPTGSQVVDMSGNVATTVQLTPAEVRTLLGTNNVWSDAGGVTLKYGHKSTGSVTFNVRVSSGSGFVASEDHTVTIIDPPSLNITAPSQMTAQPYSFTASCTTVSDLIVIVTSSGAMGQYPDGVRMQTAGDTIYSERVQPEWTEDNDEFTTTVTLPSGLDFWDGVTYNMTVTAVDRTTNLRSDEIAATFDIDWSHKAVDPEDFVTVTPVDEITEDGARRLAVEIALTPPTDSAGTDVYDIYRIDGGAPRLIGQGFPLTQTTTDEYAPIGEGELLYYRIALRTVDGDVSFADIEYDLPVDILRLDWRDGYVELPYNISVGDGYSKSVDIREHMDGSVDGYWNPNISRKASLSTDAIPLVQSFEIEAVRRLARYAGAVFVRTPNGGAFEADVEITNLSASNKHIANIAIDATEIGLTAEFMLPTPFELEEGE